MLSVNIHLQAFRAGIIQVVVFWVLTQFQRNMLLLFSWMTELLFGGHCSNSFNLEYRQHISPKHCRQPTNNIQAVKMRKTELGMCTVKCLMLSGQW